MVETSLISFDDVCYKSLFVFPFIDDLSLSVPPAIEENITSTVSWCSRRPPQNVHAHVKSEC